MSVCILDYIKICPKKKSYQMVNSFKIRNAQLLFLRKSA